MALLWSIANPEHELALGRMIEAELPGVPYTLSHRLNPVMREYRRTSCAAIDASLKPLMQTHLREVAEELRELGYSGELYAANSLGGVMPIEDLAERPVYSVRSGPRWRRSRAAPTPAPSSTRRTSSSATPAGPASTSA